MNESYNKQFLSIKSGCYNERGGILSAIAYGKFDYSFHKGKIVYAFRAR